MIGYGGFGQFLDHAWRSVEEIEVTAVTDTNLNLKIPYHYKTYSDWRELICDDTIEVVAVVTPPSSHHDIVCAALRAGKHVFVEKPIATTMEDAEDIRSVAQESGKKVIVDFLMRYNFIIEKLVSLNDQKVFGQLRRFVVENYAQDELLKRDHWFWNREMSGGILIEHAVHFIDIVHAFTTSAIVEVNGLKYSTHEGRENEVLANVLYEDGLIATHYHAFTRPGVFEQTMMRFVFDLATIEIYGWIPLQGRMECIIPGRHRDKLFVLPDLRINHIRKIEDVLDISRPNGWGEVNKNRKVNAGMGIVSGGARYDVDLMIDAEFRLTLSKADVYSSCVRSVMTDFARSILDESFVPRISLDDGLRSLEVAVRATQFINRG